MTEFRDDFSWNRDWTAKILGHLYFILSMFCYLGLFMMVYIHSRGRFSTALQVMILAIVPFQIINGVLLFLGALEIKVLALVVALWMSIVIAVYNTLVGLMGGIYFIRTGFLTMHFLLSLVFAALSLSIFTVLCHDVIVIYTFKTMVQCPPPAPPTPQCLPATPIPCPQNPPPTPQRFPSMHQYSPPTPQHPLSAQQYLPPSPQHPLSTQQQVPPSPFKPDASCACYV